MTAHGLVVVAAFLLAGCGGGSGHNEGSRVPAAAKIAGTYDLTTTFLGSSEPQAGVGSLTLGDELHVELSVPAVAMHGTLQRDGTISLEGHTTNSDVISPVHGSARVRQRGGVYRLEGSIDFPDAHFAMERPVGSDLSGAAGRYRLAFARSPGNCDCPSFLDLAVPIGAAGSGSLLAATEMDVDGAELAEISFGAIDVAPSGRFHFEATYLLPDGTCPIGLGGGPCQLRIDGVLPRRSDGAASIGLYELLSGLRLQTSAGNVALTRIE